MPTNYILCVEEQTNPEYTELIEYARGNEDKMARAIRRLLKEHGKWYTRMLITIEKEDK